jgi:hypothetical protein
VNRFRKVLIGILAVVALGYGLFQLIYPTCTFRYKLTAEVMTPDGLKTGSSVIEVNYSHNADWGGGRTPDLKMIGEATFVDLGGGKNLFVTLNSQESGRQQSHGANYKPLKGALDGFALPLKVFNLNWVFGKERELCMAVQTLPLQQKFTVPLENLPALVSFSDLTDPDSVSVVQPDLIASLHLGFELHHVVLEITQENPSSQIESILPWLPSKKPKDGSIRWRLKDPLIDRLHFNSFKNPT